MLVHSTVTGQEITLTGIDIVMCVQFLITSAKYCLSYILPPGKKCIFIYLQVGLHCTKPFRLFNLNIYIPVLFCYCLSMLKIYINKNFLPTENYWKIENTALIV
jgi:hypothetical protein